MTPTFSPTSYLATLHDRHQTLEDLRAELRTRSQTLSKELLDLVNTNYEDFLSLGASLKGGDEKVEEVRVGLLGFKRDVEAIRKNVSGRQQEVAELIEARKRFARQIATGRALLAVVARIDELDERLMVGVEGRRGEDGSVEPVESSLSDDDSAEEDAGIVSTARLQKAVQQYLVIRQIAAGVGPDHPFLLAHDARMTRIRNTLLLDLASALKQATTAAEDGKDDTVAILGLYRDLDEAAEALQILQDGRP